MAYVCKLTPGHKVTVHLLSITRSAGPPARAYYTPISGIFFRTWTPPITLMSTAVAFMGTKTPSRAVISRGGKTCHIMVTSPVAGSSLTPAPGGSSGAISGIVLPDTYAYDIHHAAGYPYHASPGGLAPGTHLVAHYRPFKTIG